MKKNILYLSPSNRWLGARISLYVLLKMLDKDQFHPIIICPSREGPFASMLEAEQFDVRCVRLWNWRKYKYFIHRWVTVGRLKQLIQRENIHLIHCNEFWTAPYAYWASRGLDIPLITHVRLSMTPKKIRDYYLGKMTRIICVCKALVEEFSAWPDYKKRVVPIYNGVNLEEFNPETVKEKQVRTQYNIPSGDIIIGLVGQISRRKGQDQLIRIAPRLIDQVSNVRFLIVGSSREPEYEREIHEMIAERNLKEYFIFTGDMNDMPGVYKSLDVLVLPSLREGFGRVVVEAEAMEIPVIVSNAGGLVEVVDPEKTGFIFSLGEDQQMLDHLVRLCKDESLRRRMGKSGRELVRKEFSQEIMIEKVTSLYIEVLKDGPPAG